MTRPLVQRSPVHGTGLEVSPHGFEEVPVGVPAAVVLVPGAAPAVGGVPTAGAAGVAGTAVLAGVVVGVQAVSKLVHSAMA